MSKYKLVIFDVDGTLLNTTEGVLAAVKYTIDEYGLEQPSDEVLETFIGPPIQDSFRRVYGLDDATIQEMADCFRNRYKGDDLLKAYPYEGIFDVVRTLKDNGILVGIATYKRQDYAERIVRHFGFGDYTDAIFGADNFNKLKKVDIIKNCVEYYHIDSLDQVVMIGDSGNDAIGAEKIGVDFIGVTYGFDFKNKEDVDKYKNVGASDTTLGILNFILE